MSKTPWMTPRRALPEQHSRVLTICSFLLPLLVWCLISYVPFLWHPNVEVIETRWGVLL